MILAAFFAGFAHISVLRQQRTSFQRGEGFFPVKAEGLPEQHLWAPPPPAKIQPKIYSSHH